MSSSIYMSKTSADQRTKRKKRKKEKKKKRKKEKQEKKEKKKSDFSVSLCQFIKLTQSFTKI